MMEKEVFYPGPVFPVLEVVEVALVRDLINFDLSGYPEVQVVASRMTEEGWELLLEGEASAINQLLIEWEEVGVIVENR